MYFLSVGFPRWDGYAIYNDPEVAFLISTGALAPPQGDFLAENWWIFVFIGSVAAVAVVLVVFRARVKSGLLRLRQSIGSALHRGKGTKGPSPKKPPEIQTDPKGFG